MIRRQRFARAALVGLFLTTAGLWVAGGTAAGFGPDPVRVSVIGDSLSTGINTPGDPWTSEAQVLFRRHGQNVRMVNAAENGAGYAVAGQLGDDYLGQADEIVGPATQVVLVFGSDNDLGQADLAPAVTRTLAHVTSLAPRASLVVVGPPAPPADSASDLRGIRDVLRTATRQAGGRFVDPLSSGWFHGAARRFVSSDGEHPNRDGERYLARRMAAVLAPTFARVAARAAAARRAVPPSRPPTLQFAGAAPAVVPRAPGTRGGSEHAGRRLPYARAPLAASSHWMPSSHWVP
jgi:acyl-CoA thioesterase I